MDERKKRKMISYGTMPEGDCTNTSTNTNADDANADTLKCDRDNDNNVGNDVESHDPNRNRDSDSNSFARSTAATVILLTLAIAIASFSAYASASSVMSAKKQPPNIIFLIDESTDGRTYRPSFEAIDLINIRRLFQPSASKKEKEIAATVPTTVQFDTHYVTAPVCAASRASIWSGKYPHKIPHLQAKTGMKVRGAWNNFEGLPHNYTDKIQDVLERFGYDIKISGKTDWVTGGHSLDCRLSSWTIYANLPYNTTNNQTGFADEYGMCTGNGTIHPGNTPHRGGYYHGDWGALNETTSWIVDRGKEQAAARRKGKRVKPFFAYQGMNIVHPDYFTSSYWYQRVNHSAVKVPVWKKLEDMHPCDFQASMLKGCLPRNSSDAASVYSQKRRKQIRAIYYAMILEFDSMVGAYLDALEAVDGLAENTIVIVTSDHGDMQMEHQQFYKMVAYDASSRVPLIIKIPVSKRENGGDDVDQSSASVINPFVTQPTSHIDIFPTIMDLAGVPHSQRPRGLHGESLVPFLVPSMPTLVTKIDPVELLSSRTASLSRALLRNVTEERITPSYPARVPAKVLRKRPFVVNQFHGCDVAMSWFSIVDESHFKYTVFGTGEQHEPQLFDLLNDPDENTNLASNPIYRSTIRRLDNLLRYVVDYESVALDVAKYTHASLGAWVNATSDWKTVLQGLRWSTSFDADVNASIRSIQAYLDGPPKVYECRSESVWPPPPPPKSV